MFLKGVSAIPRYAISNAVAGWRLSEIDGVESTYGPGEFLVAMSFSAVGLVVGSVKGSAVAIENIARFPFQLWMQNPKRLGYFDAMFSGWKLDDDPFVFKPPKQRLFSKRSSSTSEFFPK